MSKSIIVIPSRLSATRLPNKPLIKIRDKSLIMHVYDKAVKSQVGEVYVATCDQEIALEVDKQGGKFVMTENTHTTGTDRVWEASKKLKLHDSDYVINVQGDEPMINPNDIKNLHKVSMIENSFFSTLAHNIKKKDDYKNKNIVKVITENRISQNLAEQALNFTRIIDLNNEKNIYHHIGIYLYKFSLLKKFVQLKKSKNEINESLEQLRALDNKIKINVIMANYFSTGIDTKKDLDDYIKFFNK
tara:strand:- start:1651 stop:2385 length:735 start_codon:yes stop_codon:yes gene_type:complete